MRDDERGLTDAIREFVPYDGPHSADTVREAADGVALLVRYMNNATSPGNDRSTLGWASTVDSILGSLSGPVYGLDQLFGQLAGAIDRLAADGALYDNRPDRSARETAAELSGQLRVIGAQAITLAEQIQRVHSMSARLGNQSSRLGNQD